ncbi:hypothetical protein GTO91_17120 [Heliobacterium undosum]|uniref:Type I restriction modification DNA specificity domain-containing protein n=1 Tax=Heliomicrobium undosum TaxID=121734 RepID=A0A845L7Z6_9FIRM|nr:restriction endonuclease subunit S [Heliomicrobium undosum]MZP31419.1 hypothetical protein [Heliomicrobium undosum]
MGKKIKLPNEELLLQSLVISEDKPFDVPSNWVWVRLGSVAKWGSGGTPSRKFPEYYTGNIPWIKTGELNNNIIFDTEEKITEQAIKNSSAKLFPVNTVVIAMYGATIGKVAILGVEATTNQACACAVCLSCLDYKYLFYYLLSQKEQFIEKGKGGAQPNISQEIIKQHAIPLPPISEQRRIVILIESLFEKLDRVKELVQNALDSFETRKSAILHKAITGELTAKWRVENGVDYKSDWRVRPFKEIATVKSNLVDPMENKDLPHIAPDNIEKRTGRLLAYNTIEQDGVTSPKHRFYAGQILYSKIRPYLSKAVVVDFDGLCSADMYPIETQLNTRYLWYYMLSDDFVLAASSAGSRSVLPKINQKELGELKILCPPISEQKEIVRILDEVLEIEQKAKELCDVVENIELMKKSILARAFRGELGTNNPNEESALELLKEVLRKKTENNCVGSGIKLLG